MRSRCRSSHIVGLALGFVALACATGCATAASKPTAGGTSVPAQPSRSDPTQGHALACTAEPHCSAAREPVSVCPMVDPDDAKAAHLYEEACERGDSHSCTWLGSMLAVGRGVPEDLGRSASVLDKACAGGDMEGCTWLGDRYRDGEGVPADPKRAMELFTRACSVKHPTACRHLGLMLLQKTAGEPDLPRATSLFEQACSGNDALGCLALGESYWSGRGVAKDPAKAKSLASQACDCDDLDACTEVGWWMVSGTTLADYSKGVAFLERACDGNSGIACNNLGWAAERGRGLSKDPGRSLQLYQKACDLKARHGCVNLAKAYHSGIGTPVSMEKAVQIMRPACEAGDAEGCSSLGLWLTDGEVLPRDRGQGLPLVEKACDKGVAWSCNYLGWFLANGDGVPRDPARAEGLYSRACKAGNQTGCNNLKHQAEGETAPAAKAPPTSPTEAPAAEAKPFKLDSESVIRDVESVRGLRRLKPVVIKQLDDATFEKRLSQGLDQVSSDTWSGGAASLLLFGMSKPEVSLEGAVRGSMTEQLIALYDFKSKQVLVRKTLPDEAATGVTHEMLVAHEVEHALQDQHFNISKTRPTKGDQDLLAWTALIEGDATATMLAFSGLRNHQPPQEALIRAARVFRSVPAREMLAFTGHSDTVLSAPPIVGEQMMFPYFSGTSFVERLELTGGFDLVNKAFANFPVSTAQIIHPERFLQGVVPRPIDVPPPPSRMRQVDHGEWGELGTRVILSSLASGKAATIAAELTGDSYAVWEGDAHVLGGVWVTTWTSDSAAAAFEDALRTVANTWPEIPAGPGHGTVAWSAAVHRWGNVVVMARGLDEKPEAAAMTGAPALVQPPVEPKPTFGEVALAPEPSLPEDDHGVVADGVYRNGRLGLTAHLPDGFKAHDAQGLELMALRSPPRLSEVALGFVPLKVNDAMARNVIEGTLRGIASATHVDSPKLEEMQTADVGWGTGWFEYGSAGPLVFKVQLIRACGGDAGYIVIEAWQDSGVETELDAWVRSIDASQAPGSPGCAKLHNG